jgi:hypothetical protein
VLEVDQRRAIATALTSQVDISGGPGVGKNTSVRVLVDVLERPSSLLAIRAPARASHEGPPATVRE